MRIAIIGAGLSGLACAHELERLGYSAEIFEKRDRVGKMFTTVETMLQAMQMDPNHDVHRFLRDDLHLPVNPAHHVTTAVLHSAHRQVVLRGDLGYTSLRGAVAGSFEAQLARHVRASIRYDQDMTLAKVSQAYDRIVIANGSPNWSKQLDLWEGDTAFWIRGATVTGDFNPCELHFFFQTKLAGRGYAMLSPFDSRLAAVGVGLPASSEEEVKHYWEVMRRELSGFWEREIDQWLLEKYELGRAAAHVTGKYLLTGNAGGFMEPLGFTGQVASLASGVYAAREIVLDDGSLRQFARRWLPHYERMLRVRRTVSHWGDPERDRLLQMVDHGVGSLAVKSPWSLLEAAGAVLSILPEPQQEQEPETGPDSGRTPSI